MWTPDTIDRERRPFTWERATLNVILENSACKHRQCFRFSITSSSNVSLGLVLNSETVIKTDSWLSYQDRSAAEQITEKHIFMWVQPLHRCRALWSVVKSVFDDRLERTWANPKTMDDNWYVCAEHASKSCKCRFEL